MKKIWTAPDITELDINETAYRHHNRPGRPGGGHNGPGGPGWPSCPGMPGYPNYPWRDPDNISGQ